MSKKKAADEDDYDDMPPLVPPGGFAQAPVKKAEPKKAAGVPAQPVAANATTATKKASSSDEDEHPSIATEKRISIATPSLKKPATEPKQAAKPSPAPVDDENDLPTLIPASAKAAVNLSQAAVKPQPTVAAPASKLPSTGIAEAEDDEDLPALVPANVNGQMREAKGSSSATSAASSSRPLAPGDVKIIIPSRDLKVCLSLLQDAAFRVTKEGVEIASSDKDSPEYSFISFSPKVFTEDGKVGNGGFSVTKKTSMLFIKYLKGKDSSIRLIGSTAASKSYSLQLAEKGKEDKVLIKADVKQTEAAKMERQLNSNIAKINPNTPFGKPKLGPVHLCNVLCHLSQFGSLLDVTLEGSQMSFSCGGQTIALESAIDTKSPKPVTIRALSVYRFIEVLKLALNFIYKEQEMCKVFCIQEVPGVVVTFEGDVTGHFLIKENKKKG